jgi:hypothetical protein
MEPSAFHLILKIHLHLVTFCSGLKGTIIQVSFLTSSMRMFGERGWLIKRDRRKRMFGCKKYLIICFKTSSMSMTFSCHRVSIPRKFLINDDTCDRLEGGDEVP